MTIQASFFLLAMFWTISTLPGALRGWSGDAKS
jgi:hypothetical protein